MHPFQFQKLDSYQVAKQICGRAHALKIGQRELRDQVERAVLSSFLNLSEGRADGNRKKHYAIALGSLGEVAAAVDMAIALGLTSENAELESLIARLGAMLTAMLRESHQSHAQSGAMRPDEVLMKTPAIESGGRRLARPKRPTPAIPEPALCSAKRFADGDAAGRLNFRRKLRGAARTHQGRGRRQNLRPSWP